MSRWTYIDDNPRPCETEYNNPTPLIMIPRLCFYKNTCILKLKIFFFFKYFEILFSEKFSMFDHPGWFGSGVRAHRTFCIRYDPELCIFKMYTFVCWGIVIKYCPPYYTNIWLIINISLVIGKHIYYCLDYDDNLLLALHFVWTKD